MHKSLRRFVPLVCLLFLPTTAQSAFVWHFTNSGLSYSPTDTIFLEAQITNTGSEAIVIDLNIGSFGQGLTYGSFPNDAFPGPGDYELFFTAYDELVDATLLPGESTDFLFGFFTPVTSVAPGVYETLGADLQINGWSEAEANGGRFVATVVPVPPAFWLFASGIVGLVSLSRGGRSRAQS